MVSHQIPLCAMKGEMCHARKLAKIDISGSKVTVLLHFPFKSKIFQGINLVTVIPKDK